MELPRPLKPFQASGVLSSFRAYEPPTSALGMQLGISVEIKDFPIQIGNEFDLLTGHNAPYRYKLIEHDDKVIREYVTIADGPITSRDTSMFTLWMNQTDKETYKVEKFYFWDLIEKAREHFGFQKCDLLSQEVKDTLAVAGVLSSYPGLERAASWPTHRLLTDELSELDKLHMLRENLRVMDLANMGDYWLHPADVLRGVDLTMPRGLRLHSGAGQILSKNVVVPKDLKWMLSPDHVTKPYHMCLRSTKPLHSDAEIQALQEYTGWFDVLKYIELIPYSELFVEFDQKSIVVMRVYDPYDHARYQDIDLDKVDEDLTSKFTQLREALNSTLPTFTRGSLYRSWGEEVYITLRSKGGSTKQFYFDLTYAALGSRLFTPEN